jgi:hypothetical protein
MLRGSFIYIFLKKKEDILKNKIKFYLLLCIKRIMINSNDKQVTRLLYQTFDCTFKICVFKW